ncbi:MAG: DNA-directed RNA polymerase subunit alpha [Patescibacteria group bacterium]|nr:DNA-directed RNA polymerase subunit alpha [Patescibacteria group bacterium]
MENILLPSKMSFSKGEKENESILTIEPLHHGYGTTVGNALRRVLLSSLEGAAVTAVKIQGVQHEFSAVEGVKEDVLEIVLNLKQLRLKVHTDEQVILKLSVSGKEGEVSAKEIGANADVEIINPDLVLATMTSKDAKLEMEITVGRGRGYSPTEEREASGELGLMGIDSLFSPVVNVSVHVENTRVGEITNYDKLIMTILTDGSLAPEEAVESATEILLNHYNWIQGQLNNAALTEKIEASQELAEETEEVEAEPALEEDKSEESDEE